jgi:CheY-like chemotaxis protein
MTADVRVLIIDDEESVAELLGEIVETFGHRTLTVTNAAQALTTTVREFLPHVVLLDLNMPSMAGGTLLEHLRTWTPSPAVIMVTGNVDEEEARRLLARGAFDYVTKPVDIAYLRQAITAAAATTP